ncbi:MAG: PEP-CTERM sorting domain-containing protein [Gammaproteobacteria bacterium]|nr:PEP-CTERM sorting domain-containing protein [Gammaproteobacteria bacterium]MBQ0838586.1 PEP-CTERM sorting domain-containing protein [Gammaproteobacteria bacterium]
MFPELNILFAGLFDTKTVSELALYTFHIDFRLGCDPGFSTDPDDEICSGAISGYGKNLNNGYEQIFIGTQERLGVYVPEPGTALLFGLGLAGLGYGRRRSSK